jgi:hypothetical protein
MLRYNYPPKQGPLEVGQTREKFNEKNPFNISFRRFYIRKELDDASTLQEKLDVLNECDCCDMHALRKPRVLESWDNHNHNFKIFSSCVDSGIKECVCNCRHLSRFICREVDSN